MSLVGIAVVAIAAVGAQPLFAQDGDAESGAEQPSEPGIPYTEPGTVLTESVGHPEDIVTGGSTYDPTILTKFIPASGFIATQGLNTPAEEDGMIAESGDGLCTRPDSGPGVGGTFAQVRASLELPDGARIKRLIAYGADNYAPSDMVIQLDRVNVVVPNLAGAPTRAEAPVTSFNTSTAAGNFALASEDNLEEIVGSFSNTLLGTNHRFHQVYVLMANAALANHVLCGVEVEYQVPATTETGTVFHPISPIRAYDSRNAAYPSPGLLAPNSSKVISIKDGHDSAGVVNALDVVPVGATAITYNITIGAPTGPNFVAVTPGDAASFLASAVNFNGTADIANAATVAIDANRQIKVWGGDQSGSAHVIIDVTGYYTPPVPYPNMGN
ncbi:MAG TPA: hypothetical protein VNO51_25030 [Ilumatobacteraceae bacterium]|nr:hypothetical protein [Ilumatobacteraceae bacterium]